MGIELDVCGATMKTYGWTNEDLLPGLRVVPNAHIRVIDLQLQGYAYIRF